MTETPLHTVDDIPAQMLVDPNMALHTIALTYHDHTCRDDAGNLLGADCPERKANPGAIIDGMDAVMPALIAVANVATQLALLHLTVRFDMSPEQAQKYGIYPMVDWASMMTLLGCAATFELDNGDTVECTEKGQHPIHRATYQGIPVNWDNPDSLEPKTPEEAVERIAAAHAVLDDPDEVQRKLDEYTEQNRREMEESDAKLAAVVEEERKAHEAAVAAAEAEAES